MSEIIYIITIHHIQNFGSELQAYALQHFLETNGYPNTIIDYRPNYYNVGRSKFKFFIKSILYSRSNKRIEKKCNTFIKTHMKLTSKTYFSNSELSAIQSCDDDIFIAGGDQLWNTYHPCGKDGSYKLNFVKKGRKISYGTSIGRNNLTQSEIENLVSDISEFESIGLREFSTVEMLKEYKINDLHNDIDPVFLLGKSDYFSIAKTPSIDEPYVLFYQIKKSELIDELARRARLLNVKIVQIGGRHKECDCDIRLLELSADEMLGLVINAQCILSNSFHATAFSVMMNKPFYTLLHNTNTNTRMEDFLGQLGLEKQIVRKIQDIDAILPVIDYTDANAILQDRIRISKERLLGALARIKKD